MKNLNRCKQFVNLNLNSHENQIKNADHEMQNAYIVQSAQNTPNLQNENGVSKFEKVKLSNIEMCIEKTIDEKMKKIQSHLNKRLNQIMNLV